MFHITNPLNKNEMVTYKIITYIYIYMYIYMQGQIQDFLVEVHCLGEHVHEDGQHPFSKNHTHKWAVCRTPWW